MLFPSRLRVAADNQHDHDSGLYARDRLRASAGLTARLCINRAHHRTTKHARQVTQAQLERREVYRDDSRDEGDRPVLSLAGGARSCGRMTHRRRPGTLPRRGRSRLGGGPARCRYDNVCSLACGVRWAESSCRAWASRLYLGATRRERTRAQCAGGPTRGRTRGEGELCAAYSPRRDAN